MNEPGPCDTDATHAPLTEILVALGEEFSALGQFTEQFQSTLSPALLQLADDPECHRNVQTLDLLSQRLAALSGYVLTISQSVPQELRVNAQTRVGEYLIGRSGLPATGRPGPAATGAAIGRLGTVLRT